MGFPKCMEDNEELWSENNFGSFTGSIYGLRRMTDTDVGYTMYTAQNTTPKKEGERYGRA